MLAKPKLRKSGRKPANFYCQTSIFSQLVCPEASCVKCECCLFLTPSFMNHCPLLPLRGKTYVLDAHKCQHISCWNYMMSFVVTVFSISPWPFIVPLLLRTHPALGRPHASLFHSVPVERGVAFSCCQY